MDWSNAIQSGKLCVYPLREPVAGDDTGSSLATLALDMERIQHASDLIVVDAISNLASSSVEQSILSFFTVCKRLTNKGKTILLATHSSAFNAELLARVCSLCETYLNLRTGKIRTKVVRVVKVVKLDDVDLNLGNEVSFEVEAGVGISIIPYSTAKG